METVEVKDPYLVKNKKLWRCNVCNDLHYGDRPPAVCPTCGAKKAFSLIDNQEAMTVIDRRGGTIDQVDQLLKIWYDFAKDKEFKVADDVDFVKTLAQGELENMKNHGLKYCPCRITTGNEEQDLKLICPCNFFIQPTWKQQGECWCGLFVRR